MKNKNKGKLIKIRIINNYLINLSLYKKINENKIRKSK